MTARWTWILLLALHLPAVADNADGEAPIERKSSVLMLGKVAGKTAFRTGKLLSA